MADSAPQSEAAKRAAARKAKILARGNTGLAKLAQTARGDEAQALYADDFKPSPSSTPRTETPPPVNPTPSSSSTGQPAPAPTQSKPSWAPEPPSASTSAAQNAGAAPGGMSVEQQAMSAQLEAMMSMFGGAGAGAGGGGAGAGEMPDFSKLMAQMMGVPPDGAGAGAQNLLGDVDDPAGLGGMGPGGIPPNLFGPGGFGGGGSAGSGFGAGDSPFPFAIPGMTPAPVKSKAAKWFPLVHFISIVLLSLFSVLWWEPTLRARSPLSGIDQGWSGRWAGQLSNKWVRLSGVEAIPVFWAFTTLELILQTTRFMIFKSPPPPHSLIQTFLPILPPKISRPLVTGSRYLNLLSQFYKDGALFVFIVGLSTVVASWLNGR